MLIKYLLLPYLFCLTYIPLWANWQYPILNYSRHQYEAGAQNWMLTQQDNGWIYAANDKGLLEFDGINWKTYSVLNAKLRAVAKGEDGNIYVGGFGECGYFEPDGLGGLSYNSLCRNLPFYVGVIRNILTEGPRVYFQADRYIIMVENGQTHYVDHKQHIVCSALYNESFYLISSLGMHVLQGEKLVPVTGTEKVGKWQVVAMLPYRNQLLLITRQQGIYAYDGTSFEKVEFGLNNFLEHKQIYTAFIQGSILGIGFIQDGVCLYNLSTGQLNHLTAANGLQDNTVHGLLLDVRGNLWLAMNNGIDCVELSSNLFSLHGGSSFIGSGYASCVFNGQLYLATNRGVYYTEYPISPERDGTIKAVQGISDQVWSFLIYDNQLFCAAESGIFLLNNQHAVRIDGISRVRSLVSVPHRPDVLVAGTYGVNKGLYLLKKQQGVWRTIHQIKNCDMSSKSLLAESSTFLWMTNKGRGVSRLLLSDDLTEVRQLKNYNPFPMDYDAQLSHVDGEIVVASRYGLWRFDPQKDSLVVYKEMEERFGRKKPYTYFAKDIHQNIWCASEGILKLLRYQSEQNQYPQSYESLLKGALIENFEQITVADTHAIIGTEDGFSLMKLNGASNKSLHPFLQIRHVYSVGQKDSLIYGRSFRYEDKQVVIPYKNNTLRMECCVSNCAFSKSLLFSYRLDRSDEVGMWSDYSTSPVKEFTNLREGKYTFRVRLQTDFAEEPASTSFQFEILPPWYRTGWSYMGYTCLVACGIYYMYRRFVRSKKLLLMQKELELYHQQQAFDEERAEANRQIHLLEEEKLQTELRHQSEELVRTTLNIVRKNEMLLELKKGVDGVNHALKENDAVALKRRVLRLQGQITTNIGHDEDLQSFQSAFDSVHHDFFRRLEERYPDLSHKEKMLCAYVQMNLITKEIAPLLNISVRGVEICRYRLRQKLGLKERDSLPEFLKQFSS